MKKFIQIDTKLSKEVNQIKTDKDISNLGFKCKGKLCEYDGYGNFNERLWVWAKTENEEIYIVVSFDTGNSNCNFAYKDMYIKEVIDEIQNDRSENIYEDRNRTEQKMAVKLELVELMPPTDRANNNRERINDIIRMFNEIQTMYKFDAYKLRYVKATIELCKRYGKINNFSDLQFEILDKMYEFIKDYENEK